MTKLQKFSSFINRLIPPYARLCALAVIAADLIAYYLPKALDANRSLHLISTALDDALPLVPAFILVYVLAYLQWVFAGVVILRDSRAHCFRFVSSFILAMFLAMAVMLMSCWVLLEFRISFLYQLFVNTFFITFNRVAHEHGDGHWPYTAGNRCNSSGNRSYRLKINISY